MPRCKNIADSHFCSTSRTLSAGQISDETRFSDRSKRRTQRGAGRCNTSPSAKHAPNPEGTQPMADQSTHASPKPTGADRPGEASRLPDDFLKPISDASRFEEPAEYVGSVGRTMLTARVRRTARSRC